MTTTPATNPRPIRVTIVPPVGVSIRPRQYECAAAHLGDGGALVLRNAVLFSMDGHVTTSQSRPIPFLVTMIGPGWEVTVDGHLHGV